VRALKSSLATGLAPAERRTPVGYRTSERTMPSGLERWSSTSVASSARTRGTPSAAAAAAAAAMADATLLSATMPWAASTSRTLRSIQPGMAASMASPSAAA
jgi:hypothetical protein